MKEERTQRSEAREEPLIKILEKNYGINTEVEFDKLKQNGYKKEMLEGLHWIIENFEFAVNYIESVDIDPLARKKRFSSMLEEL